MTPRHVVGDDWRGDGAVRTLMREAFPGNLPPAPAWAVLSCRIGPSTWKALLGLSHPVPSMTGPV